MYTQHISQLIWLRCHYYGVCYFNHHSDHVYMRLTSCVHTAYILCTCGLHQVYMRLTSGVHAAYIQCTCGLHPVYMRLTCVLWMFISNKIYIQSTTCVSCNVHLHERSSMYVSKATIYIITIKLYKSPIPLILPFMIIS